MTELGHLSLICGVLLSGFHAVHGLFPRALTRFKSALLVGAIFAFFSVALASLIYAHVVSDFSVIAVATNSHSLTPLLYKIAGVWGYHQGSALLWAFGLSACGVLLWWGSARLPEAVRIFASAVQSGLVFLYGAFLVLTSNPFLRHVPFPVEGLGLNPLLQDPGLTYHPPTLFGGHVFLSVVYSLTVALLITGQVRALRVLKPWVLLAFAFLTLGILMGSFWAYYVLGWGGWWFWDPVEVVSLLPWLMLLGLIHSLAVQGQGSRMKQISVFLALGAVIVSVLCTFVVRSGLLTSVHSFALDLERGLALSVVAGVLMIGSVLALKKFTFQRERAAQSSPFVRTLVAAHLVCVLYVFVVALVGILGPLIGQWIFGVSVSLGPRFYQALLWIPLCVWMGLLSVYHVQKKAIAWRSFGLWVGAFSVAALGVWLLGYGLFYEALQRLSVREMILFLLAGGAGLLIVCAGLFQVVCFVRCGVRNAPAVLSHLGVGLFVIGLVFSTLLERETYGALAPGEEASLLGERYQLDAVYKVPYPDALATRAHLLFQGGKTAGRVLHPERHYYYARAFFVPVSALFMAKGALYNVTLGDPQEEGRWQVRVRKTPLLFLVWLGGLFVFVGCLLGVAQFYRERKK